MSRRGAKKRDDITGGSHGDDKYAVSIGKVSVQGLAASTMLGSKLVMMLTSDFLFSSSGTISDRPSGDAATAAWQIPGWITPPILASLRAELTGSSTRQLYARGW